MGWSGSWVAGICKCVRHEEAIKPPGGGRDGTRMTGPGSLVSWALWPECWWSPDNRRGREATQGDEACLGPFKESQHPRNLPIPKGKWKKNTQGWGTRQVCHVPSLSQAGETGSWRRGKPGLLPLSVFRLQLYSFLGMEPETQKFTEELKEGLTEAKITLLWSTCFSAQRQHTGLPLNTFRKCVADELKQNNKTTGKQLRG